MLYTLDASLPVGTRSLAKNAQVTLSIPKVARCAGNVTEKKLWTTTYRAMQDEILYNDGSGAAKE
ncbi:MAG: hypothetical protein ACLUI3_07250 [Christensenellales bacterium]